MNPNKISEDDKKLLVEVAAAKGMTVDELLVELGHIKPAIKPDKVTERETDETVYFSGEFDGVDGMTVDAISDTAAEIVMPEILESKDPPPPPMVEDDESNPVETHTHLATMPHKCVHCGWDQKLPDIQEPADKDKLAFLQSVLGQTAYKQRFNLFGGKLRVTFRTLNIREIDAIYLHVFEAQKKGEVATIEDYYEMINRCRVYLQLVDISGAASPLHIKLPTGFNKATTGQSEDTWETFLPPLADESYPPKTLFNRIIDYIIDNVLKTEQLQRSITQVCTKFNRTLAKMEACIDNPDFWEGTEQPS